MSSRTIIGDSRAVLVLPHLRVQNANAISTSLTHGFPSITAFVGFMWALQRQIALAGIPLKLEQVGVICHHHEEQVTEGYVKTFRLTRNPLNKDGVTAPIVEEGRMHLDVTVIFKVAQFDVDGAEFLLTQHHKEQFAEWASQIGEMAAQMRIAGGTLLPVPVTRGRRTRPWMSVLSEDGESAASDFKQWRRQWLPGYTLVGRDDLLAERHQKLQQQRPDASLLDAWLDAVRFNYRPVRPTDDQAHSPPEASKKIQWADPDRPKGSGWTVPIAVGYAALTQTFPAGTVKNARDAHTPFAFVESIYSLGEWKAPHRLHCLDDIFWWPESDLDKGIYRCRSGYVDRGSSREQEDECDEYD